MKKKKKSEVVEEEPKKKKKLKETVEIKEEGFGDEPSNPFKADWKFMLSTGSTLLDLAVSGKRKKFGGIPTGILVEISGKSGAGKCFSKNNYITATDGVFTVEELFEKTGNPAYKVTKPPVLLRDGELTLTNMFGNAESVRALTFNGHRHIKKITTKNGIEHEVTLNHPLKVMTRNGNVVWKQAENIQIGEYLLYRRGFFRDSTEKEIFSKKDAYIAGMFIADGYLTGNGGFTNNEPFLMKKVSRWLSDNQIKHRMYDRSRNGEYSTTELKLSSRSDILKILQILDLPECKSKDRFVPSIYRCSGKQVAISFLKGYVDCEGFFTHSSLEVTSASKKLLSQVQQILIGIGILSSLNKKTAKNYPDNEYWRLYISGSNFIKYVEIIGSALLSRKEQFKGFDEERLPSYDKSEIIPHQRNNFKDFVSDVFVGGMTREEQSIVKRIEDNLTKEKLLSLYRHICDKKIVLSGKSKILFDEWMDIIENGYFFSEVISNKLLPEKDYTYDVSMENTASFLLNSCVSHNTAILTELCASAQKKGGEAYFNDPEARLDKEYAKITGYSLTDEKLYDRPDTVTALFDNFKSWKVNPEFPNVFAGDSLAALSTNTEMEDEDKMGMRRAKEFSQELRKSARMFSKKNVLMACSNQLRDSPTGKTTPGGNAIPFYSSLRMEVMPHFPTAKVKREKTINGVKHSKVIGIQSDVTIIKNSLDDPFRKVPIYIIFGYGIDDVRGNLMWLKESTGEKKFIFDNKEFSRIEDAIAFIEENNLEKKLRKKVVDLWNELEEAFKTNRKPKSR